jgi:hypothetical protein
MPPGRGSKRFRAYPAGLALKALIQATYPKIFEDITASSGSTAGQLANHIDWLTSVVSKGYECVIILPIKVETLTGKLISPGISIVYTPNTKIATIGTQPVTTISDD